MENTLEKPQIIGKTSSGLLIFFTPGKSFTQAFYNQEKIGEKESKKPAT